MIPCSIKTLLPKKIVGKRMVMSVADNKTSALWSSFMPRRKEITKVLGAELFSMQVYPAGFNFKQFDINATFEKWAAVEVSNFESVPEGMETFTLPGGLYAVFIHKGPASEGERTFKYIFTEWLPASGYVLANRPHFEVLGDKYKNEHPDSEEEVWIPVEPVQ